MDVARALRSNRKVSEDGTLSAHRPEGLPGLPVNRLAERLLAGATLSPALITRRSALAKAATKKQPAEPFSPMALLADPALDIRQYLEDLVTIAMTSAQQAEDVSAQARAASKKARRSMAVVAGIGAVGLLVGVAGFTASRSSNVRLSELRDEITSLQDMQRQAQEQLGDIATRTAETEQREALDASRQSPIAPAAVVAPSVVPQTGQRPAHYYSEPWPDTRPQPRRAPSAPATHSARVVVPQLFADIGQGFRAIFH